MGLAVAGAAGRMGRALVRAVTEMPGVTLTGAFEQPGAAELGRDAGELAGIAPLGVSLTDDPLPVIAEAEGLLDFTVPAATVALSELTAQARIVHVIGTTGLSADDDAKLAAAARHAPIIRSGNMSLGVNLAAALVREAARALDPSFDIEILEMHHRAKVDAPSGTAYLLGKAAAEGRGIDFDAHQVRARDGQTGPRPTGDIGLFALRGGTVVGEHRVLFAGSGEVLEIVHRAEDRSIFARGAVTAALWGRGRKPGLYAMTDVLGLGED